MVLALSKEMCVVAFVDDHHAWLILFNILIPLLQSTEKTNQSSLTIFLDH